MKNWLNGAFATCSFELRRSFTFQRTSVSLLLALFPPVMLSLLILGTEAAGGAQARSVLQDFAKLITILLVSLVCLLSVLLWATPNVYSELEGKSWGFIASRPGGRVALFLGKFFASFLVSYGISILAISLCVVLTKTRLGIGDPQGLWIALSGIYFFGCIVYAAVFSFIGTLFIKRAMVVAAGYLVGSDIFLASIPGALVNKFTIRYHMQEIGIHWLGWFLPAPSTEHEYRMMFGDGWHISLHILVVILTTIVSLAVGAWIIVNREYITADES